MGSQGISQTDLQVSVDPCLEPSSFSPERFALFLPIFLTMIFGTAALLISFIDYPYGIQTAAAVCYTSAIVLYTFSANRGLPRYLFSCPIVRAQLPRLAIRYLAFLAVLLGLVTVAFEIRPHLPESWLVAGEGRKSIQPFTTVLFVLSGLLALIQILTNRSLLERAHSDRDKP